MTDYLSIYPLSRTNRHVCKFNVTEQLATETLLPHLRSVFEIELLQGKIASKNERTIIEFQLASNKALVLKQVFLSQLPIFEHQN